MRRKIAQYSTKFGQVKFLLLFYIVFTHVQNQIAFVIENICYK